MTDDLIRLRDSAGNIAARPLMGMTVLVVEDSRFACEAMRLLCLRSGARIRRADCLRSARRHLATYRPTAVIVDLGLPDGSGADLIRELSALVPRVPVILGTSGNPDGEAEARAAGADGFLAKPIESLAAFQHCVLSALPVESRPLSPRALPDDRITPDALALRDDLSHVAGLLMQTEDDAKLDYVAQFLSGVAQSAHDQPLEAAAAALASDRLAGRATKGDVSLINGLVQQRLAGGSRF